MHVTHVGDDLSNIVVLQADGREFGLILDAVRDTEEIVVKPPGRLIGRIEACADTTIVGDGKVAVSGTVIPSPSESTPRSTLASVHLAV